MEDFLDKKLAQRIEQNSFRALTLQDNLIDFSSNDYLGFAKSVHVKNNINCYLQNVNNYALGATGSRLISGNTALAEELEVALSQFHQAQAGLLFNSGYDANLGLFSCIAQKGDTIICDEFIHACIIDGARLSLANKFTFKHNDLNNLESKLKNSKGNIFIAVESVYSMDGDIAPLIEIINLAKKYHAHLIVDEAHATGIFGNKGEGLVQQLGLQEDVFARVVTFGKALASHGAIVLGSVKLKNYLINFARSFIYTTALPLHSLVSIKMMYQELEQNNTAIKKLECNIQLFKSLMSNYVDFTPQPAAIQSILIKGNNECKTVAQSLQKEGFDVRAILSPTVPLGKERLRICLHTFNTQNEIQKLCLSLSQLQNF